ncbi:MAG: two-component system response regulator [Halioglobus sp.]
MMNSQPIVVESQNVVAIDDDELSLELIRRHLRKTPHTLSVFLSAEKALEYLAFNSPSVLIVDHRMPRMEGLDVLSSLDEQRRLKGVRVYLCSAVALPASVQEAASKLGATAMLKDTLSQRHHFLEATELL